MLLLVFKCTSSCFTLFVVVFCLADVPMSVEELFAPTFCQQSEFNDWNRVQHETYLVSHSSDTQVLCHMLNTAEAMLLGHELGK